MTDKKMIIRSLLRDGYSEYKAKLTADDLCRIKEPILADAVFRYAVHRQKPNVGVGKYTVYQLTNTYSLTYPAALIWLDWYLHDSGNALKALKGR